MMFEDVCIEPYVLFFVFVLLHGSLIGVDKWEDFFTLIALGIAFAFNDSNLSRIHHVRYAIGLDAIIDKNIKQAASVDLLVL